MVRLEAILNYPLIIGCDSQSLGLKACLQKLRENPDLILDLDFFNNLVDLTLESKHGDLQEKVVSSLEEIFKKSIPQPPQESEPLIWHYYFTPGFRELWKKVGKERELTSLFESTWEKWISWWKDCDAPLPHIPYETRETLQVFISPERDRHQKPELIIERMGLKEGDVIADVGAGAGYFTFKFSKIVGEKGKVYALDIHPLAIELLEERIKKSGVKNVEAIPSRWDSTTLKENLLDFIFLYDVHVGARRNPWITLYDRENKKINWPMLGYALSFYRDVYQALKPKGKLVYMEPVVPSKPLPGVDPLSEEEAINFMEAMGFRLFRADPIMIVPDHTFLIFEKP